MTATRSVSAMRRDEHDSGFSLFELATVIAIMGVLVALSVPAFRGFSGRAVEAVLQENANTLETKVRLLLQEDAYDLRFRTQQRNDPDIYLSRRLQEDLQASAIELVDTTVQPIENPVSGNDNVMLRSSPNTNAQPTPPAVFITGSTSYRHERVRPNANRLSGTLVIMIDRRRDQVEVYYMDDEGVPSGDVAVIEAR